MKRTGLPRGVCLGLGLWLGLSACLGEGGFPLGSDGGENPRDGGTVHDAGTETDGGAVFGCVYPRADRLTVGASVLYAEPSPHAAIVEDVPTGTVVIPIATDATSSCPDGGFYFVQQIKHVGWIPVEDTGDSTCTRGSAFDSKIEAVVMHVFGKYGDAGVAVTQCESGGAGTQAVNGQYYGLFQMGSFERATYGDSICAEGESIAAFTYFAVTGYDWSPWTCKP